MTSWRRVVLEKSMGGESSGGSAIGSWPHNLGVTRREGSVAADRVVDGRIAGGPFRRSPA
jgi:hypothetical protein